MRCGKAGCWVRTRERCSHSCAGHSTANILYYIRGMAQQQHSGSTAAVDIARQTAGHAVFQIRDNHYKQ